MLPSSATCGFQRVSNGGVEKCPRPLSVDGRRELVRVDPERDRRVGMPELPRDVNDVGSLGDEETGEGVPQVVERRLATAVALAVDPGFLCCVVEAPALYLRMLERAVGSVREDRVGLVGSGRGESMLP